MAERRDTPLPRGRHALPPEEVAAAQRDRVLRAMADVMAERGYAATSVADVLKVAGVSRSTFYELFRSKEDCFMQALEAAVGIVLAPALREPAPDATPHQRLAGALRSYLDAIAGEPALARVFLVEVYAAGPEASKRRAAQMDAYASVVAQLLGAKTDADRFAARTLVAGITMLVTLRLVEGDVDGIRALYEPLLEHADRVMART